MFCYHNKRVLPEPWRSAIEVIWHEFSITEYEYIQIGTYHGISSKICYYIEK